MIGFALGALPNVTTTACQEAPNKDLPFEDYAQDGQGQKEKLGKKRGNHEEIQTGFSDWTQPNASTGEETSHMM